MSNSENFRCVDCGKVCTMIVCRICWTTNHNMDHTVNPNAFLTPPVEMLTIERRIITKVLTDRLRKAIAHAKANA